MSNKIEVEKRAMFDQAEYSRLGDFLAQQAEDLGEDDKDVVFFVHSDKLLKVVNNISGQTAKIVYKSDKIGNDSALEEIEVAIAPSEVEKAIKLLSTLGHDVAIPSFQKRHNYSYKGVEIALKHSDHWGYHLEMEVMIEDRGEKDQALAKIGTVATELGINLMTDEEISAHTDKIEKQFSVK